MARVHRGSFLLSVIRKRSCVAHRRRPGKQSSIHQTHLGDQYTNSRSGISSYRTPWNREKTTNNNTGASKETLWPAPQCGVVYHRNFSLDLSPVPKKRMIENILHRYHRPYKAIQMVNDISYIVVPVNGRRKSQEWVYVSHHLKPCLQRRWSYVPTNAAKKKGIISVLREAISSLSKEPKSPCKR